MAQILVMIQRINRTNCQTPSTSTDGETLADALARRDVLKSRVATYRLLIEAASLKVDYYTRTEIKNVATINVRDTQKRVDDLSKELRELDTRIQGLNWTVDLVE